MGIKFASDPFLMLKLTATTMGLSISLAKLYAYERNVIEELKKDLSYFEQLTSEYALYEEDERKYAEELVTVSYEADKLAERLSNGDES